MVLLNYFDDVAEGVQFLIAFGSIMGLLGIIFSILGLLVGGNRNRVLFLKLAVFCIVLLVACGGPQYGIKYFRIH